VNRVLVASYLVSSACLLVGCGAKPEPPAGTGAREAVSEFFDALAKREWNAAYDRVAAESRKHTDRAAFAQRADRYVRGLGFDFAKAHLRTCDEQGEKAIAHLNLSNAAGNRKHSYRESIMLQRDGDRWGVVLPSNFGRK